MISRSFVLGITGFLAASCSGQLFVRDTACRGDDDCKADERCAAGHCVPAEEAQCTLDNPLGTCASGSTCQCGVCTSTVYDCCNCTTDQDCVDGQCQPRDPRNECSPTNPSGDCAGGEVCVGGCCVPISNENSCSADRPGGLCPTGTACVAPSCVPVNERPCVSSDGGLCGSGQACVQNACIVVDCSPQYPYGFCGCGSGPDQYCRDSSCWALPCSPQHLQGVCDDPTSQFCSVEGQCIPKGTCLALADCPWGSGLCSCPSDPAFGQCIGSGFCRCNEDCNTALSETCDVVASQCVRSQVCQDDGFCLPTEICSTGHKCITKGTCEETADCRDASLKCSAHICIPNDQCASDVDCVNGVEFCSCVGQIVRKCAGINTCVCDNDCPPAQTCVAGSCQTTRPPCTYNAPAACVDSRWCCPAGKTCCPQGQRCSLVNGHCIDDGTCLETADCPSGFTCASYACVPDAPCMGPTCPSGQFCSVVGGCTVDNTCAADKDCPSGEVCNALFECEPAAGCGSTVFSTTKVPPNMLIVLDKSGSMGDTPTGQTQSKIASAKAAISTVTQNFATDVRFGLATFPSSQWAESTACIAAGAGGAGACDRGSACTNAHCIWNGKTCSGSSTYCSAYNNQRTNCQSKPACSWNNNNSKCSGNDAYCQGAAAFAFACGWTGSACAAQAATCSGYAPGASAACGTEPACSWASSTCTTGGSYCGTYTSGGQTACASTYGCTWTGSTCVSDSTNCGACAPGRIDVAVADSTREAILCSLNGAWSDGSTCPKPAMTAAGNTPSKQTLANIAADRAGAGLASADRGNFVLFITDGETNCMTSGGADNCTSNTYSPQNYVDPVLDGMSASVPPVRTFVVGLIGVGHPEYLNCYAIHGGRSRCPTDTNFCSLYTAGGSAACTASHCAWDGSNNCVGDNAYCGQHTDEGACGLDLACAWTTPGGAGSCIGNSTFCSGLKGGGNAACRSVECYWTGSACVPVSDSNCANTTAATGITCYYNAGTNLLAAFSNIAGQVAGCAYILSSPPAKPELLFVYLDYQDGNDPVRLERDPTHTSNWDFDTLTNQVTIYGAQCDLVKAGTVTPVVIMGCDTSGG